MKKIAIFYHGYLGNKDAKKEVAIILEQLQALKDSGLGAAATYVRINIFDPHSIMPPISEPTYDVVISKESPRTEYPTLVALKEYADTHDCDVLYLHAKGAGRVKEPEYQYARCRNWRLYMEHFCIGKWKEAAKILETNDTYGVEWHELPWPHYSGNFWWATSDYIKRLKKLDTNWSYQKHGNEKWIGTTEGKHFCPHDSGINLYNCIYEGWRNE